MVRTRRDAFQRRNEVIHFSKYHKIIYTKTNAQKLTTNDTYTIARRNASERRSEVGYIS